MVAISILKLTIFTTCLIRDDLTITVLKFTTNLANLVIEKPENRQVIKLLVYEIEGFSFFWKSIRYVI